MTASLLAERSGRDRSDVQDGLEELVERNEAEIVDGNRFRLLA